MGHPTARTGRRDRRARSLPCLSRGRIDYTFAGFHSARLGRLVPYISRRRRGGSRYGSLGTSQVGGRVGVDHDSELKSITGKPAG